MSTTSPPATMPNAAPLAESPGERGTLSRDLSFFLVELSIALRHHLMYPVGHPAAQPTLQALGARLDNLLADRSTLSIGIARRQLVIEGVATESRHPVLGALAQMLHDARIGAVTFHRGATSDEIARMLRILATHKAEDQLDYAALNSAHIRVFPVSYERLELLDGEDGDPERDAGSGPAAELWMGLAQAAMAADNVGRDAAKAEADQSGPEPEAVPDPPVVAQAINRHADSAAYDQVIVGYLLQIAEELRNPVTAAQAAALRRRVSQLVSGLEPDTLQRLLQMGGDEGQRGRFLMHATEGFAADAVIELLQAAASETEGAISHSMVRLLRKMATQAERGPSPVQARADATVRDQVRRLLSGWQLSDPNPDGYTAALETMSRREAVVDSGSEANLRVAPDHLLQMAVELDLKESAARRITDRLVHERRVGALMDIADAAPPSSQLVESLRGRLADPETAAWMLAVDEVDLTALDRLLVRVGDDAVDPLLDALESSDSRPLRRAVFNRLVQSGAAIAPRVVERLPSPFWYVERNLLALMAALGSWPESWSPEPYARHADARVRREAYKILFATPESRDPAITAALDDEDETCVRLALQATQRDCPFSAVPALARLASDALVSSEVRVLAIRGLGASDSPFTLPTLLRLASTERSWMGRPRIAAKSSVVLAALTALSNFAARVGVPEDAAAVLAEARRSRDPEIRIAARVPRPATERSEGR